MGQLGNAPRRNADIRRPWNLTENISIAKTVKMASRMRVDVRAEAFNVFNHASFNNPSVDPSLTGSSNTVNNNIQNGSLYGALTNTANAARQWQFALRYEF